MKKHIDIEDLEAVIENGEQVLYVVADGKRIAKRYSGQGWVNIEPGYVVHGGEPGNYGTGIEVEYVSANAKPQ
jgi:hypothetical protein